MSGQSCGGPGRIRRLGGLATHSACVSTCRRRGGGRSSRRRCRTGRDRRGPPAPRPAALPARQAAPGGRQWFSTCIPPPGRGLCWFGLGPSIGPGSPAAGAHNRWCARAFATCLRNRRNSWTEEGQDYPNGPGSRGIRGSPCTSPQPRTSQTAFTAGCLCGWRSCGAVVAQLRAGSMPAPMASGSFPSAQTVRDRLPESAATQASIFPPRRSCSQRRPRMGAEATWPTRRAAGRLVR
jgi:hypothetical protein